MTREQMVLNLLKPKVKAFGFNQKELKGIAAKIANNLSSAEDASEEDVNAEIEAKIEAAIPYLQFAQSQANRLLEEWRKNHPEANEDEDDEEVTTTTTKASKKSKSNSEENEKFKQLIDAVTALTGEVANLKKEKTTTSRKARLEELLKNTGTFGSRTLKSFSRMNFESDEEFEEFFEEIQEDLETYNQERANDGLGRLGKPSEAGGKPKDSEVLTDDEIKALANL